MNVGTRAPGRTEQVMGVVQRRLAGRHLLPGDRLPSVRKMAAEQRVSTSTVVEAYDRLVAEGLIEARRGAGFYVAGPVAPLALSAIGPQLDREIDPLWVSRQSLDARSDQLMPGCGWLPADWMPEAAIRRALRALSRAENPPLAEYGSPLGLLPLRQIIGRRLSDKSVNASVDQIMLTESGTQAIDLLCRYLLQAGDTVLVDDPCYFNFLALLKAHRVQVVGVPVTPYGPDADRFAQALQTHKPRLYITNAGVQNPTGARLAPSVAHQVLSLAEEHDLIIIEDEIFADFEEGRAPRYAALGGLAKVIQIGSFSKSLSAAARCGFIAARPDWIDALTDLKIATAFGGGRLDAELVLNVLRDSSTRKHIERLRSRLSAAMSQTAEALANLGITPWSTPQEGMFVWARLPDDLDAATVARAALEQGVILAPGNVFSQAQSAKSYMRFNVSRCSDDKIFDVLEKAMSAAARAR